jgi:ditrans,polycis-polyprenyl diphosphate synthase
LPPFQFLPLGRREGEPEQKAMIGKIFLKLPKFITKSTPARWFNKFTITTAVGILTTGVVPKHVALIMDGNRRYAKTNGLPTHGGHEAGSVSLLQIIDVSLQLGIQHLTVYAFSIENFKRSQEEVEKLFSLLVEKLQLFLDAPDKLDLSVQVRIVGNRALIPQETLVKLEEIERLTSANKGMVLNVCFAYTTRDEISHSVGEVMHHVLDHEVATKQIDEEIITENFYFKPDTPPVDLLIRTSGHTRLSDFLMWHVCEDTNIEFLNVYWPDFTVFHFCCILVKYGFNKNVDKTTAEIRDFVLGEDDQKSKRVDLKSLPPPPPFVSISGNN